VDAQSTQTASPPNTAAEQKPVDDPLGRSTPHGTVVGLIRAAEQNNLDRAAEYLEPGLTLRDRRELARQLWIVLDRKLLTSLDRLSDKPDGDLGDGLTARDRIGLVESPSGDVELFVDRVQLGQASSIWLFASSTMQEIPRLYADIGPAWFERYVPERFRTARWLSLPLYQWFAILLAIPLVFALAALLTRVLTVWLGPLLRRLSPEQDDHTAASRGPVRVLVLALVFYAASFFGLTLATRHFWQRVAETLTVIAVCWLSIRLSAVLTAVTLRRLERAHRPGDVALVRLLNRLWKAASVIVAGLALLYLSDVDLTAALTGLGVGGIALGFGAQKTIENLFGGIMVISDKPINVGDECKAGEYFGTVEDIGIRSTRIRTLDRTVVAVPNGLLASMILENFAERDRIRFLHTVGLAPRTTADQLRDVLSGIRQLLDAHPTVDGVSARTRFVKFSGTSLDIEILAYVLVREQPAFLAIQEELLLGIMDIIETSGTSLAVPLLATTLTETHIDQTPNANLPNTANR
jgi:MscS family membrane protein